MITDNTYYKGEIYIPQAKPSISDDAVGDKNDFYFIIDKYEESCLKRCLGNSLYREFVANIDTEESSLIKAGADSKWDWLMNGHEYTKDSKTLYWKGIRFKTPLSADEPNSSFLANYVYFYYMRSQYSNTTIVGEQKESADNSRNIVPTPKVIRAWREFVEQVQGVNCIPSLYSKGSWVGVDYYQGNDEVSLYDFILDMNIDTVTYENFVPYVWRQSNEFGL